MNLFARVLFVAVVFVVAATTIVAQRWTLGQESTDEGPLVTFYVSERLTRSNFTKPPIVLRTAIGPLDLPKEDALQRASNESGVRVLEPASLPDGFTVRNIAVVNRWPNPSYVELVYSDGEHAFTLRLETTSAKLGTVYGTSFVKALEVPNNPDMFGVSDEGRFIAYYRRTPRRGYDIFMGPPDHPLTQEEALKVLVSLPSR